MYYRDDLKYMGGGLCVIYKYCAILYKGLEYPQILVHENGLTKYSPTDTEGRLYTSFPGAEIELINFYNL
jgi:hypothetical protein